MSYLDTDKSIMISSPAGSGKTEKLARRYIALLQKGVEVERILAITFTEKASAEMKQRILKILKNEDEPLFRHLLEKIPLMRVSTIHSFCGTLLRRFSFEAAIDPNYKTQDAIESGMEWDEILHDVLMAVGAGFKPDPAGALHKSSSHIQEDNFILQTLSEKGFRGLDYLKNTVDYLFQKTPFSTEARSFIYTQPATDSLIEELRSWHGVKDAIDGYEKIFEDGPSNKIVLLEDYFMTKAKDPRQRAHQALKKIPDFKDWAAKMYKYWEEEKFREYARRGERTRRIFEKCLAAYTERKKAKGALDFSDLEYISYKTLTENPEWANILYAFDEKTDHILVDEFQDTNTFQWTIIDKLTEEWRSGMGAKREEGTCPTIFLVGDEKQSIYYFRGANVEIFRRAREKMQDWLGDEFQYEEAKENYRSLPAIVEFTNHVFSKIMYSEQARYSWETRYSPFSAHRPGIPHTGRVEVVLLNEEDQPIQEAKQKEADVLAQRIQSLVGNFQITDRNTGQQRFCRYTDIVILLRKRTHLRKYEEALRSCNIPFVTVKGIGFYQEPEVAMLRALVFFLSNPCDDYSLYILLKGLLFNIGESVIIQLISREGDSLFEKMKNCVNGNPPLPPFAKGGDTPLTPLDRGESLPLKKGDEGGFSETINNAVVSLQNWLTQSAYLPLSEIIEQALVRTKAWRYFHEPQRRANIKKFIRIIEELEAGGKSLIKIRDFLERTFDKNEEPKANVNTEGMDAVKIMTIHAAKGLEFPVVFIPGIEEQFKTSTNENLVYEKNLPLPLFYKEGNQMYPPLEKGDGGGFFFKSIPEPSIRKGDEDFQVHQAKEEEEQKRLFYVAVTRAGEALVLIGHWNGRDRSFLSLLRQGLDIEKEGGLFNVKADIEGLAILSEEDVQMLYEHAHKYEAEKAVPLRIDVIPVTVPEQAPWKAVTETADIRRRHGKDWLVLGDIMHRIFEGVSKGMLQEQEIAARAKRLLESKGTHGAQLEEKLSIIDNDISLLKEKGIWQNIIMPREDSFTELPFILEAGDVVYSGRIDRLIKENDVYKIYDYKTFPVKEKEVEYLLKEYSFQLNLYKKAVRELYNTKSVQAFIVFTHTGEVIKV
ncbi:MAG: UvrD-helicase domain-containing protein [Nitrospirae bacterium]|nr:UvrD-helicase domain-containing protein [Nitrospirota bacterium]